MERDTTKRTRNMKVVCIIDHYNHITVVKTYDVVKNHNLCGGPLEDGDLYCISDDDNLHRWIPKECFNLLEDFRERRLKELGILDIVDIPQKSGI